MDSKNNNTDVPQPDTLWKIKENELSVNNPITLEWVSPDDFIFTRTISIDNNYMFTIEQKVKNNSKKYKTSYPMEELIEVVHQKPLGFIFFMKVQ